MEFALPRPYNPYKKRNILIAISIISLGVLSAGAILVSQVLPKREQVSPEKSEAADKPEACATVTCYGEVGANFFINNVQTYGLDECESCASDPLSCLGGNDSSLSGGCTVAPGETSCSMTRCKECGGIQIHADCGATDAAGLTKEECQECSEGEELPPGELACTSLSVNPNQPAQGDSAVFTCNGTVDKQAALVQFKVIGPTGTSEIFDCPRSAGCGNLNLQTNPAGGYTVSEVLNYPDPIDSGQYKACCRICEYKVLSDTGVTYDQCTEFDERCN